MMTNYPGILFHQVPVHRSQVRPDNIIIPAATSDYAVTVQFQRCLENQPENPWSVDPSTEGWIVPSKPESPSIQRPPVWVPQDSSYELPP